MNKTEFLSLLRNNLAGLDTTDIENSIQYYSEMIDDRIEEGLDENTAVASVGTPEDAAKEILKNIPITKLVKEKVKASKKPSAAVIILLILGSPLWIPLMLSLFSIILSLYVSLWAVVGSLWSVPVSLGATALAVLLFSPVGGMLNGIGFCLTCLGAGFILTGLCIFSGFGCVYATKGLAFLTKKAVLGLKYCFIKKEATK
jgi:uncharacterized membrane protein